MYYEGESQEPKLQQLDKIGREKKRDRATLHSRIACKKKDLFGNVILITLFKYCGNTCRWKSIVKISIVLFKQ